MHDTVLGQSSFKKDFIWNIIGSVCAAGSSIIYLMVVTRVVGDSLGGIFSYAYASAQLMLTIGRFGMRAFQATDLNQQFSFASYLASRVITCALMLLTDLIFLGFSGYDIYKFQIMFWVCVLKMSDAIEDIFHGEMQQKGRLYLAGKLLAARNILSFLIFSVILIMTADLLLACLISAILSVLIAIIINIKFIPRLHFDFSFKVLKSLFFLCIPLFLSTFFSLYIYNSPKNAIDRLLNYEIQTYYGILFMPAFVINLFSEFAFKPYLTSLASLWIEEKITNFLNKIKQLFLLIIVLTIVTLVVGLLIGLPILSWIYGIDLSPYLKEFMILLLGGGFGAGAWLLNNVLSAIRKPKELFLGYLITSITATIIAPILVKQYGMIGAAVSYLITIFLLFALLTCILVIAVNRTKINRINN